MPVLDLYLSFLILLLVRRRESGSRSRMVSFWILFLCGGEKRMPILDLYFLVRRRESDAVFGSFFVRWLAAVLIALVRMVASGKCDFNPGVADSDQLSCLGCTSFLSDGAAVVFDAAVGAVVFSDAAATFLVGLVLWLWSFLMGLVLWLWSILMLLFRF